RLLLSFFLLIIAYCLVPGTIQLVHADGASIYVAPNGNDANPGTQSQPLLTVEHAQELARTLNQNMTSDITIYFAAGTYQLSQPLTLTDADSGSNGHNVIYKGLDGQQVIISGGMKVDGWQQKDATKNIWAAPLPNGIEYSRQLYVNG